MVFRPYVIVGLTASTEQAEQAVSNNNDIDNNKIFWNIVITSLLIVYHRTVFCSITYRAIFNCLSFESVDHSSGEYLY